MSALSKEGQCQYLTGFGDEPIARAEGVVGSGNFLRNPGALAHPQAIYTDRSVIKGRLPFGEHLQHGSVALIGQGPLPIENRGQQFMAQMGAFSIQGVSCDHGAFVMTHNVAGDPEANQTLHVVVDDLALTTQHGQAWDMVGEGIEDVFYNGGGAVALLPEVMHDSPPEMIGKVSRDMADVLGIQNVHMIQPPRQPRYMDPALKAYIEEHGKWSALKRARILGVEQVLLPWSDKPFVHMEVGDTEKPADRHHLLLYGPFIGMDNHMDRVHSQCSSSQVFGARNCECSGQLDKAGAAVVKAGMGGIFLLDQEARGHGVWAKVQTWGLNIEHKIDLIRAFNAAGLPEDAREFQVAAEVFEFLRMKGVYVLTNNESVKVNGLYHAGVNIQGWISVDVPPESVWAEIDLHAKREIRHDNFERDNHKLPDAHFLRKR